MNHFPEHEKFQNLFFSEINSLIGFLEQTEFKGWEPYDTAGLFSDRIRVPGLLKVLVTQFMRLSPVSLMQFFQRKKIYPKAAALFAQSYLLLYKNAREEHFRKRAILFLNWLEQNRSPRTQHFSMGTHYGIAMKSYAAEKDTPSPLITSMAVETFISAFEILGENKYFELANSGIHYFLDELPQRVISETERFFIYHPENPGFIPNLPAVICGTLARFISIHFENDIFQTITHNLNFLISWQREDGSWLYEKTMRYIDNFHTGFILEGLLKFELFTRDSRYNEALKRGMNYWRAHLFTDKGKPIHRKLMGIPKNADALLTRLDARDIAQSLVLLSYFTEDSDKSDLAMSLVHWSIQNFKSRFGYFYYQQLPFYKLKGPFISMQAWMMFGLVKLWDAVLNANEAI